MNQLAVGALFYLHVTNNQLVQSDGIGGVDEIAAAAAASPNISAMDIDLSGGTNSPPSVAGAANIALVIAAGGAFVTN